MAMASGALVRGLVVSVLLGTARPVIAASAQSADTDRIGARETASVRGENAAMIALIDEAVQLSATVRRLIASIEETDGIVFVQRGNCGQGVRSCLSLRVKVAGPRRLLFIGIDDRSPDIEAMGDLGHELQHALEVLSDPGVTSTAAMHHFFERQMAARTTGSYFETAAAIAAGDAVRAEIRSARRLLRQQSKAVRESSR
jgi:hypothetical protein